MVVEGFTAPDLSSLSRSQLCDWVNDEFELNITKVEQCGTGAVYCLITDRLLWKYSRDEPSSKRVHMHRVRWDTFNSYDFLENYKVLQKTFKDFNIQKNIDVDSLSKMRMQDNLAFLQWIYNLYTKFYDESENEYGYPGTKERRLQSTKAKFLPCFDPYLEDSNTGPSRPSSHHRINSGSSSTRKLNTQPHSSASTTAFTNKQRRIPSNGSINVTSTTETTKLSRRVKELEEELEQCKKSLEFADKDVANMNIERADYYIKLLRLDKLWRVRAENGALIKPEEIDQCFNGILPPDLVEFEKEFEKEYQDVFQLVE